MNKKKTDEQMKSATMRLTDKGRNEETNRGRNKRRYKQASLKSNRQTNIQTIMQSYENG